MSMLATPRLPTPAPWLIGPCRGTTAPTRTRPILESGASRRGAVARQHLLAADRSPEEEIERTGGGALDLLSGANNWG